MQCDYFDAHECRSCALMGTPYDEQVAAKHDRTRAVLAAVGAHPEWLPPATGPERHFRNKAKLVVGGRPGAVTLGILDSHRRGVDLRQCGLYEPGLHAAIQVLADVVDELRLLPYDVVKGRGELKHLIVTHAPDGGLMVRFVLRSEQQLARIRAAVPRLRLALPRLAVVSVNLQPEHKAVLEGDTEIVLTETAVLRFRLGEVTMRLRPQSFFQTNTSVAAQLYTQARAWLEDAAPPAVWDLYCGVGGFALHSRGNGRRITGVELSPDAVEAARESAPEVDWVAGDAFEFARTHPAPDLAVVNPPRRGLVDLAPLLEDRGPARVLYSSCSPASLARDLAAMPSYAACRARVFDMFPQTDHLEVLVQLERTRS